ncbi:MAG: uncharacterized protein A8A55_1535 [Amphiamblys sp. WSBS2006]|nr:MAG: uncharacterized protein A8A55_1535 [Amphiamblys sp. WSBS2006]
MARKASSAKKKTPVLHPEGSSTDYVHGNDDIGNAISAIRSKIEKKEANKREAARRVVDKTCQSVEKLFSEFFSKGGEGVDGQIGSISKRITRIQKEQEEILGAFKDEMKRRKEKDRKILERWAKTKKNFDAVIAEFEREVEELKKSGKGSVSQAKKEILKETTNFHEKVSGLFNDDNLRPLKRSLKMLTK